MTIPADHDVPSSVLPTDAFEHRPRRHIAPGDGLRPRRLAAAPSEAESDLEAETRPEPAGVEGPAAPAGARTDIQRYYLCCMEPDGEFVEVIVAVSDAGRRRYFTTTDGRSLTEVEEDYFDLLRESGARSMLELDDREMGELEAELHFVRSVRGRDPLLEIVPPPAEHEPPVELDDVDIDEADDLDGPDEPAELDRPVGVPVIDDLDGSDDREEIAPQSTPDEPDTASRAKPTEPVAAACETPPVAVASEHDDEGDEPGWTMKEFEAVMTETTTTHQYAAPADRAEQSPPAAPTAPAEPVPQAARAAPADHAAPAAPVEAHPSFDPVAQVSLAKGIAFVAHRGQLDRVGADYIDHPGRVAERFDPVEEPIAAASAWLHEVLEGTVVTTQELREAGVLPDIVEVVQLLTRTPDVAGDEFHARIRRHPIARRVKLAAIDDNAAQWRLRHLDYETQVALAEHYRHARELLGDA